MFSVVSSTHCEQFFSVLGKILCTQCRALAFHKIFRISNFFRCVFYFLHNISFKYAQWYRKRHDDYRQ